MKNYNIHWSAHRENNKILVRVFSPEEESHKDKNEHMEVYKNIKVTVVE